MSRLHTGTVVRPRFESRPYRPSPGRREAIYGRIRPMEHKLVRAGRRIPSTRIAVTGALIIAAFFAVQFARPLLGRAASDASLPHASGSPALSQDAGER